MTKKRKARLRRWCWLAVVAAGAAFAWHGGALFVTNLLHGWGQLWQLICTLFTAWLLAMAAGWLEGGGT